MGNFDDANVDKDLLSQIFADGGEGLDASLLEDDSELTDALDIDVNAADNMFADDELTKQLESELEAEAPKKKKSSKKSKSEKEEEKAEEEMVTLPKEPPVLDTPMEEIVAEAAPEEPVVAEVPEAVEVAAPVEEEASVDATADSVLTDIEKEELRKVRAGIPQDDIVSAEARRVLDEERKTGTVTLITENTTITGSISSDGSLEVIGEITGDIECQGKVYINGIVAGSVIASKIYVNTPRLIGGLQSESVVKVGVGTVIIGDVSGNEAYIAGAVKGNIDINGAVVIDSTAVIKGDIRAKSIQINSGAVVDGYCSLNYADVDVDGFFSEQ